MPSMSLYKKLLNGSKTDGEVRKSQSEMIIENTWWEDIASQKAYLFDWYHDPNRTKLKDFSVDDRYNLIPIDIKYIINSKQTYSKDPVTYHIQLRPSQTCNVDYYDEFFKDRYDAQFPNGMYILIKDNKGKYNRWLVVGNANFYDPMFSTFDILPCDKVFQWIYKGKKYKMAGVLRSQNSYNSGLWTDYKIETVEDQQKFIVPLNRDSENIYYNMRLLLDNNVLSEPRAWHVSKINRLAANGLCNVTLAQDRFDQNKDFVEIDEYGQVIGMWADYYRNNNLQDVEDVPEVLKDWFTFSGKDSSIKVGGSYKTITVHNFGIYNEEIEPPSGQWLFTIDGEDASSLLDIVNVEPHIAKIKFIGANKYIGKKLTITYKIDLGPIVSIDVDLISL